MDIPTGRWGILLLLLFLSYQFPKESKVVFKDMWNISGMMLTRIEKKIKEREIKNKDRKQILKNYV